MKKLLLIIFLLVSINCIGQYKFQFTDTLNGKVVLRDVTYKYPLPVFYKVSADTTKIINFNNGILTVPFPIKLYNYVFKLISLNLT